MKLILRKIDYERVIGETQKKIYFPIEPRWTKKFVSEEGRNYLLTDHLKGNRHINAALAAWDIGYKVRDRTVILQPCFGSDMSRWKVRSLSISSGDGKFGSVVGTLYYVLEIGERIDEPLGEDIV